MATNQGPNGFMTPCHSDSEAALGLPVIGIVQDEPAAWDWRLFLVLFILAMIGLSI